MTLYELAVPIRHLGQNMVRFHIDRQSIIAGGEEMWVIDIYKDSISLVPFVSGDDIRDIIIDDEKAKDIEINISSLVTRHNILRFMFNANEGTISI